MVISANPQVNNFNVGLADDKQTIHVERPVARLNVQEAANLCANLAKVLAVANGGDKALTEAMGQQ